jgi:hypothetical protein
MKKLFGILAVAGLIAGSVFGVDYSNHMHEQRVYRVALGSGTAPSAADMLTIGVHNGDMVLNTDDNILYLMHATNVYTKFTSAGAMTTETLSADALTPTALTLAGIDYGTQTEALGTNESASVTIAATLVNITGPTNASAAVITLGLPTSDQVGLFSRIINAGTNTLSVVYKAATTNDVATTKACFLQAISTSAWDVIYTTP